MWQVFANPQGGHYVHSALSENMSMIFIRVGSAAVFLSIVSHKAEPRAFDKARLPIIAVDGESVFDLNKEMELNQRANPNLDWCFSEDRSVGAIIWAGDQITPTATIRKFIAGNSVNVRLFFDPFEMGWAQDRDEMKPRADARKMRAWNCGLRLQIGRADRGFDVLEANRCRRDYAENTWFTLRQVN